MRREIEELTERLARLGYVADRDIATAIHLTTRLRRPLLVEGEAGVGKTEIAKVVASLLETELNRLQCYEGLDVHTSLYEWNYQRQLLRIRMEDAEGSAPDAIEERIFSREYLLERPLLRAITRDEPPVLLIDEIDRSDEEFEAFLLEVLSDFQVSIPELGTVAATERPYVVLTSNSTRELSDALRRRCLYLWIDYPSLEKELAILRLRRGELSAELAGDLARFVHRLREEDLYKTPGVAETLDWAEALEELDVEELDAEIVRATLGCLIKDRHDLEGLREEGLERVLADAGGAGASSGSGGAKA